MRSTSNPAFRNLPVGGGGYAGFNTAPAGLGGAETGYGGAPTAVERPMTIDDVVNKTGITLGVLLTTGALTYFAGLYINPAVWFLAVPAALVGFILAMVIIFKKVLNPGLVVTYGAVEGVFLAGVSALFGNVVTNNPGIIFQAITGTALVFAGMLYVYKSGAVRVTPRFTKWLTGALIGVVGLMIINLVANLFFGVDPGLRSGGTLAIIFSLVCIGVAAFSFLLDFDAADRAIRAGAPEKTAWYIAFGLTVTLVWLYIEIIRLLSYFQGGE